ncbi:hypothetical protein Sjap_023692 [Stephania japonica]|uniref:Transposase MuDR plant domain-containing protein n=1 Tax=Stephania japonica TaxID=461633 RepID=A0AAP0EE71_9MAGN
MHRAQKENSMVIASPSNGRVAIGEVNDNYSDYASSAKLCTDDDSNGLERKWFPDFNERRDMANPDLELGMNFSSFMQFKSACKNWSIKNKRQICFTTNDKTRCICVCHSDKCTFQIYASHMAQDDSSIQIESINPSHTCSKVCENYHVTSDWIAQKYLEQFRADPNWSVFGIVQRVKDDLSFEISRMKAWRAKKKAMEEVNGDEESHYRKLYSYFLELQKTNPCTTIIIK